MKFQQEFEVGQDIGKLWSFFEQPELVAECMPGMESIQVIDSETFVVQVTQKVGPISATFESRVIITDKVKGERVAFNATGKAVRGAIGNFRAESVVTLHARGEKTLVRVESEAALAGVLGSVGQKIIARQAEKITEEFARNLEARLSGGPAPAVSRPGASTPRAPAASWAPAAGPSQSVVMSREGWAKVAAALSLVNIMIGLVIICKLI